MAGNTFCITNGMGSARCFWCRPHFFAGFWRCWERWDLGYRASSQARGNMLICAHDGLGTGSDDFRQGIEVRPLLQAGRHKMVPEVVHPKPAGDAGAFERSAPGVVDSLHGPAAVVNYRPAALVLRMPFFEFPEQIRMDRDLSAGRAALVRTEYHDRPAVP